MPVTNRLKRIKRRRSIQKLILLLLLTLLLVGIYLSVRRISLFLNTINTNKVTVTPAPAKNTYTYLILGYGGGVHDGTYLTDTIIVAHIDRVKLQASLISIPRDIWIQIVDGVNAPHAKINSLYQMGLFPQDYPDINVSLAKKDPTIYIKRAAKRVTGLPIDGYIAVDFTGFEKVIDVLDGIDVTVDRTFTDYQYPVEGKENELCDKKDQELEEALKIATQSPELAFPCRYETLEFKQGQRVMDGKTALKFARSRHSLDDGGDFNRALRQQKVIEAVKAKVLSIGFIPRIIPLMNELEKHIRTDIAHADIQSFLFEAPKAGRYRTRTYVIERELLDDSFSNAGGFILVPQAGEDNWTEIQKAVKKFLIPSPTRTTVKK